MDKFQIQILGCGSALPTLKRNPSSQCLNLGEKLFLIDCGEGTQIRLRDQKIRFQKINHIFISHLHGDHYFGLPGLISSMHLLGRKSELHVYGPPGLEGIIKNMMFHSKTFLNYELIFHSTQFKEGEVIFENDKVTVSSFPLKHRIDCTGFLFKEKLGERTMIKSKISKYKIGIAEIVQLKSYKDVIRDDNTVLKYEEMTLPAPKPRSYAYCSDTKYTESIIPFIRDVDVLYHESTFLEALKKRAKETFHSTAQDAAKIAKKASASKLFLGHYSSRYDDLRPFTHEAREIFEESFLSEEGMVIEL